MWLFTKFGFFSVVQKPGEARLTVRARVAADLERLTDSEWMRTDGPNYAVFAARIQWKKPNTTWKQR